MRVWCECGAWRNLYPDVVSGDDDRDFAKMELSHVIVTEFGEYACDYDQVSMSRGNVAQNSELSVRMQIFFSVNIMKNKMTKFVEKLNYDVALNTSIITCKEFGRAVREPLLRGNL